jgi:nucleotide-binding universal stress UspA family protein
MWGLFFAGEAGDDGGTQGEEAAMTVRKLLVPVPDADTARPALELAMTVARDRGAHVEALHVRPNPQEAVPLLGEGISGALIEELIELTERESATRADAAKAAYEAVRGRFRLPAVTAPTSAGPSAAWLDVVGREVDVVVRRGRLADLLVVGRARPADSPWAMTLHAALFESGRPLLLAPDPTPSTLGRRVAIAWNGSAEAARSVAAALSLLVDAESVTVLTEPSGDDGQAAGKELADFLGWHGVAARVGAGAAAGGSPGQAILASCATLHADLLVMGAYTHSRLRELILGGVTRHVLDHAALPVLMAH